MYKVKNRYRRTLVTDLFNSLEVLTTKKNSMLLERKDDLPILLHVHHRPFIHRRSVQSDVETAEMRLPVVGIFGFGVSVMNDHTEANAAADGRPLQHLEIPVGIAEGRNRAAADGFT